jgi:periplasmic protein TonB
MINEEQRDKKNKRIALFTSLGIHASLLIVFFFLMAWRAPNPPLPEYGVELNFGLDDQGGGEVQPDEQPGSEQPVEEQPKPYEAKPQEETKVEEKTEEPVVSNVESPVVVKEVKTEKKEVVKDKPKEKVAETKPKEEKKEVKETAKATETKKGKDVPSHGDNPGKTGDKGSPEGKPDAKALYGKQGGGGGGDGISLNMSGWAWADQPHIPDLPDNEDGRIEFEIECDESGDIIGITTLQRGLSARAEQLLKDEIRKNSLIRTSGGKVPERSKGKVVFILKTK